MRLSRIFKSFQRHEDGVLSTEAALIMPVLLFAYLGLFSFYDGFRTQNINVRASYTISDMLTRETDCVDDFYIAGLNDILSVLTQSKYPTILRVTALTYEEDTDELEFHWSSVDGGTGGITEYTEGNFSALEPDIPTMADEDMVIIVETWSGYVPIFDVGVESFYFENLVATRPRFGQIVKWDDGSNPACV
ncbi:MAG: hypothetical protein QNJ44_17365 [Rhodobacter sp.]|nr:hypothetical protein [Rhodobacter sp.]